MGTLPVSSFKMSCEQWGLQGAIWTHDLPQCLPTVNQVQEAKVISKQWETHPDTSNHTAMGHYLCVGHLIQILIGHVNHEGVNPCKREKGGGQEEDSITTTTLHLLFPLLWSRGP